LSALAPDRSAVFAVLLTGALERESVALERAARAAVAATTGTSGVRDEAVESDTTLPSVFRGGGAALPSFDRLKLDDDDFVSLGCARSPGF
jgi:hypothetical protein